MLAMLLPVALLFPMARCPKLPVIIGITATTINRTKLIPILIADNLESCHRFLFHAAKSTFDFWCMQENSEEKIGSQRYSVPLERRIDASSKGMLDLNWFSIDFEASSKKRRSFGSELRAPTAVVQATKQSWMRTSGTQCDVRDRQPRSYILPCTRGWYHASVRIFLRAEKTEEAAHDRPTACPPQALFYCASAVRVCCAN